jgi:RNA ligase (TIGR02306 family)
MSELKAKVVRYQTQTHPFADLLSIALVGGTGWQCVVGKDDIPGDKLGIYIPIDAEVPIDRPEFAFLAPKVKKGNLFRIKTIRLRGVLSQGLLIPLPPTTDLVEGQDVTESLGVTRYEPPVPPHMSGDMVRSPGNFQKYTSIENFKNFPNVFKEGDIVRVSEKIHGTNCRYGFVNAGMVADDSTEKLEFFVGSHNTAKNVNGNNLYSRIARELNIKEKMQELLPEFGAKFNFLVFGEIYGFGVQDLHYGCEKNEQRFRIFDVLVDGQYQDFDTVVKVAKTLGVEVVPSCYRGPFDLGLILSLRDGTSLLGKHVREGVVVVAEPEQVHQEIGRKMLKFISDDYLLRSGATDGH